MRKGDLDSAGPWLDGVAELAAPVVLLALAASLLALVIAWGRLARARREAHVLARTASEHAMLFATAETIAGLGLWQYDPATGEEEWSDGLCRLFGLAGRAALGTAQGERVLTMNETDLVAFAEAHHLTRETYTCRFEARRLDESRIVLELAARNLRGKGDRIERVVGVLSDVTRQASREKALEGMRSEAEQAAEEARRLAETDALTGLANRRRVMSELDARVVEFSRTGAGFLLLVLDIDHFKRINDCFGHAMGDKVLRLLGAILREQARADDVVGRLGGEEFVWILPGVDVATGHAIADRLRQRIAAANADTDLPAVTVSAGLAACRPGDSSLSLFARADEALYDAKDSGRNTIRLAA